MAGTRWVKLDTSYLRNPKITAVSVPARMMHLASILWCADELTDGYISCTSLAQVLHMSGASPRSSIRARYVDELEQAGLWLPNGDGWVLHDFDVMNPQAMRHNVEAQRKKWKQWQDDHRKGHRP